MDPRHFFARAHDVGRSTPGVRRIAPQLETAWHAVDRSHPLYEARRVFWAARHGKRRRYPLTVAFTPEAPRYFTLAYHLCVRLGVDVVSVADADVVFFWADRTIRDEPPADLPPRAVNRAVRDISKTHVGVLHEQVFGYGFEPDPDAVVFVEKSDENATHDGQVVAAPTGRAGTVLQRLIDNRVDDELVRDHRVAVIDGRIGTCAARYRSVDDQFLTRHRSLHAVLHAPDAYFSAPEQARMIELVRAIGADWAELDVLRDRDSGRLYVVDVNTTPAGPVTALAPEDLAAYWRQQEAGFAGLLRTHARQPTSVARPSR